MPVDLSSYKVANQELSSSTKFDNLVQAIQDALNALPPAQIVGYPSDATKFLRGDGAWATIIPAYANYTPTWTGTGTNPAIGNGTLDGRWIQLGKLVIGHARILMGSTTTFGSAGWKVGLPTAAALTDPLAFFVYLKDASAGEFKGLCRSNSTSDVVIFSGGEATVAGLVTATNPFTWTTNDELILNFMYEAA